MDGEKIKMTKEVSEGEGLWSKIPNILMVALTFLLPIIFVPVTFTDILSTKTFLFLTVLYVSIFLWVVSKLKESSFKIPFNLFTLSALLIPTVYITSSIFSGSTLISLLGKDFGFDSSLVVISLFAFLLLGVFLFKNKQKAFYIYFAFIASAIIVMLFHLIRIVLISYFPTLSFFDSVSTNTIGKWFDLGVFAGAGLVLSLVSFELLKKNKFIKIILTTLFVLSLVTLSIVGFTQLWWIMGISSLSFFIYFLTMDRIENKDSKVRLPIFALIVLIFSTVFILAGNQLNPLIQNLLNIDFIEARPGFNTTIEVAKNSFSESLILGVGPTQFTNSWLENKPLAVNLSDLWNVDFRYGYSFVLTSIISTGILGLLAWLFFLGLYLYLGFTAVFKKIEDSLSSFILVSSFVVSLYMWIMAAIYIPSFTTLFITFLFTAIFVASLYRENMLKVVEVKISENPKYGFLYIFGVVVVLILTITATYHISERYIASVFTRDALVILNQGDINGAEAKIISALNLNQNDERLRILSEIQQVRINQVLNNPDLSDTERSNLFQANLSNAVQSAQNAIQYDPENYLNYLELGTIFSSLVPLGIEGSADQAREILNQARTYNQNDPSIVLDLARIEVFAGNNDAARQLISEALGLKSNYTEAVFLLAQIDVSEGNIETAIANVEVAAIAKPNDPVVFFQLGILLYQNEQYQNSISAFERAVILNPFYSNAKYFLGLSYDRVDRTADAILQFEDLETLNPGNDEIQFILNNLESGLAPFAGAEDTEPVINDEPENADDLPLEDEDSASEDNI